MARGLHFTVLQFGDRLSRRQRSKDRRHFTFVLRRRPMKRILFAVAVLILAVVPFKGSGQDKQQKDAILVEMMQKKVKSAQLVLEGIATADSKMIAKNAEELIRLAKSTTWPLILSPQYERHNAEFVRAAEKLVQKAKDKNTDGAALAYVEMTLSCVRCHEYVREHRRDARLDLEGLPAPLASYSAANQGLTPASRNLYFKPHH
jgi:hypothetical protein